MEWFPLADRVGAEVRGVDLATVAGAALDDLKALVWDKGVAVLRDQTLTPEDHIALANRWGGIDINNYFPLEGEHPEIAIVGKTPEQTTNIGGGWHTDHSYDQVPAMGSILVARTLPPKGGDTLFIHMGEAYDSLDDGTKAEIEGLSAFHTADHIYSPDGVYAQTDQGATLRGQDLKTGAVHPLVVRHPRTGRRLLYVNPSFTLNIVGRSRADSLPLLQRLWAYAMREELQGRVEWRDGTVAIWDNRTTWHYAMNDYHGHAREMHRITLTGEALAA
ncbi:TauD/TfdA family dioxygenase [Parafrankia sp. BMG5.11]|uniref:TauD/TfdA dioxygenase family protein n=1 Tax=Parafrankia sp. BMG5.11 TaxID=222540 RepID=UPI00103CBE08|nr:TauD/TfdA family dioxygenase [Parafrankia sp. BMG5.11]TCJ37173.1 TauD/TfdA family dioxygenase [Parafrankia sp. BMG5.11]